MSTAVIVEMAVVVVVVVVAVIKLECADLNFFTYFCLDVDIYYGVCMKRYKQTNLGA